MSLDSQHESRVERPDYRVVTRVFPSTEKGEKDADTFVMTALEKNYPNMDEFEREGLFRGFKEIFANALYHGNLGLKGQVGSYLGTDKPIPWNHKSIIVTMKFSSKRFEISVQDEGPGFDLRAVRTGIAEVLSKEGLLSEHHRGVLFIRKWQYGSPVKIEFIKDPNEPVPDDKKKILGTRATLTRDFSVELSVGDDGDDYIVEA